MADSRLAVECGRRRSRSFTNARLSSVRSFPQRPRSDNAPPGKRAIVTGAIADRRKTTFPFYHFTEIPVKHPLKTTSSFSYTDCLLLPGRKTAITIDIVELNHITMIGKADLLEAIAGKNRGLLATSAQNQAILAAIAQLEDRNPTPRPLEATDLLDGNWRLLYTTSDELLRLDRFPLASLGQIYQCVRAREGNIYNIAEIAGLPYLDAIVSVAARFEAVSERRVTVQFQRAIAGLQRAIGYRSVSDFIAQIQTGKKFLALDFEIRAGDRQGWLDITYLDSDLRIGRGNEGSVFVLTKNE